MALTGSETLYVLGTTATGAPAAFEEQTTTGAIAALASSTGVGETHYTAITTVGNGTLTAAALVGGGISRSGPTGTYTDATDTAAAIVAAIGAPFIGQSFYVQIKNLVGFTNTLTAGSGVTITGAAIIPPNNVSTYLLTLDSLSAVSLFHISTQFISGDATEVITALSTVGAGTITAAGIAGGITSRTGSQSATPFTDTTDIASSIITARSNVRIGMSWEYTYVNTTNAAATLAGGTGVTPSGVTVIPAGYAVRYLVTYTAAATITMVAIAVSQASTSEQSVILAGSTSGTTTLVATAAAGSTTITLPAVTGTASSTTGSNLYVVDVKRSSAQKDATTTTLADVTGLTGQTLVAGATYRFRCVLPGTADATGGIKYAFKYTTATLTSIDATGIGHTASAVATQHTTTTTDATLLFDQAAAVIAVTLEGTMVVNAGGTVALQMAEHAATSTASTYVGATMEFVRIA